MMPTKRRNRVENFYEMNGYKTVGTQMHTKEQLELDIYKTDGYKKIKSE